ncbi:MAG TPA: hypothetical protein VF629_03015 [Hymenobacter sp.]|jgi:hypothetical protein|uniref:hypothetical protein n=1 Tax=Hymenobacter sp. TaxID=1898978 RepID=UPI002EDA989A
MKHSFLYKPVVAAALLFGLGGFAAQSCNKSTPDVTPDLAATMKHDGVTPGPEVSTMAMAWGYSKARQCIRGKGRCAIAYSDNPSSLAVNRVQVSVHDGKIDLLSLTPSDPENNTFTLTAEDEFYVDVNVAHDLGYGAIKVLQGTYEVDMTRGEYGGLMMAVETTGL